MPDTNNQLEDKQSSPNINVPLFLDGMVVTSNDLNAILESQRKVFSALLGTGIIRGLNLAESQTETGTWIISPGSAIDNDGWPLMLSDEKSFDISSLDLPTDDGSSLTYGVVVYRDVSTQSDANSGQQSGILNRQKVETSCRVALANELSKDRSDGHIYLGDIVVTNSSGLIEYSLDIQNREGLEHFS